MAEQSLTSYPNPQQWYLINAVALTWPELYRASGNPLTFILAAPVVALCKLLRLKLTSGRLPREISFLPPQILTPELTAQRIQAWLDELTALGFRHFTTFQVPEIAHQPIMYAFLEAQARAYADVTYVSARNLSYCEFYTLFVDGHNLTTVTRRKAVALESYPGKEFLFAGDRPVALLWEAHRQRAEELANEHGGYATEMTEDFLFTHLRADVRRFVDFQLMRRLLVPV